VVQVLGSIIGITPDIVVLPTIDAIRNGRDEILDAGIDFIKKQQM
jgi:hypothetical protein